MSDLISRQAAIDAVNKICDRCGEHKKYNGVMCGTCNLDGVADIIEDLPPAQPEQKWIPFTKRPLTEEERTENPYFDYILDCKLPDDGQRILMSINIKGHEQVQLDEYYCDNGESYLDGGYEIGTEAVAWMPLPEPYKEEQDGKA